MEVGHEGRERAADACVLGLERFTLGEVGVDRVWHLAWGKRQSV